jgi:uncharacterized GH25 family protein
MMRGYWYGTKDADTNLIYHLEREVKIMKTFTKKIVVLFLGTALTLSVFCLHASAHDMWLNMRHYTFEADNPVYMTIGYGHFFSGPGGEFMPQEYLDKLYIIGSDGRESKIKPNNQVEYQSEKPVERAGTYLVVASKKGGFFTKTTKGYKRGRSKKGLKNVISCNYSEKYAKAIVNIGNGSGNVFSKTLGHKLEVVPLKDPSKLREGDYMPVKILFEGKPLGTFVHATYAGFSSEKNTFAYATKSDKKGIAKIKILKSGVWLLIVKHEISYPDPKECDKISCSSALTFEVK